MLLLHLVFLIILSDAEWIEICELLIEFSGNQILEDAKKKKETLLVMLVTYLCTSFFHIHSLWYHRSQY